MAVDVAHAAGLNALAESMPTFTEESQEIAGGPCESVEDEFEFKLFRTVERVSITEPVQETYECPVRPMSYYKHSPTPLQLAQCKSSVVTGDEILHGAAQPWPSNAARVTFIPYAAGETPKRRWRPSAARRRKFKSLKAEETERERKRLHARSYTRGQKGVAKRNGEKRASAGYPRKGAAPA